ncbi:hypothetical protein NS331_10980 [Pseudacidovorax intermedius]|uniref:Uncharacterized protein n=2 Tax=Pseudacidovorax intermedius TaxID=433924 RepID=A0A147GWI5_9BURK|nr:hypothetical protein NS331_10980 [Pseudacidovorax intermedius]
MRAVRGYSFTYEQLERLAAELAAEEVREDAARVIDRAELKQVYINGKPVLPLSAGGTKQAEEAPTVDAILYQAQVFASSWSLVGGLFDNGSQLEQANHEKAKLRRLIVAARWGRP